MQPQPSFDQLIQSLTLKRLEKEWMHNFRDNLPTILKARDISMIPKRNNVPAIVVGAGPSIKHEPLTLLRKWRGVIIACDRMLTPLLRMHVEPYCVTTVDGSDKIAGFYSDKLVQSHISNLKAVLSVQTTHPSVSAAIPLENQYYFVGMWDDPFAELSLSRLFHEMTDKTLMATGGNTGVAAWQLAYYLGCNPIGIIGLDFSYGEETDLKKTTYFETFNILSGGNPQRFLENYRQGLTWAGKNVLTDKMFLTYYTLFLPTLQLAKKERTTINLGKYSLIPNDYAEGMSFRKFLKLHKS